jgi:hypothetical protein
VAPVAACAQAVVGRLFEQPSVDRNVQSERYSHFHHAGPNLPVQGMHMTGMRRLYLSFVLEVLLVQHNNLSRCQPITRLRSFCQTDRRQEDKQQRCQAELHCMQAYRSLILSDLFKKGCAIQFEPTVVVVGALPLVTACLLAAAAAAAAADAVGQALCNSAVRTYDYSRWHTMCSLTH